MARSLHHQRRTVPDDSHLPTLRVARDERGHVRYCETIGRHYAPDLVTWREAVAVARTLEETAFSDVGLANISYCAERGWVQLDNLLTPPLSETG